MLTDSCSIPMEDLLSEAGFSIKREEYQKPRKVRLADCPELHPKIMEYVNERFQGKLYRHQALAVEAALKGENVVLATSTASGKTISFSLPVFHELLTNENSRAIFFYPTKALAGDQLKALEEMAARFGLGDKIFRFDGDVDTAGRKKALQKGRILLCTPDVLHTTMLKRHREPDYDTFFNNLRFVVLDECHIYSGAFGSNMAFVIRRLRQICQQKNATLQFLAASATSSNPGKHMEMLTSFKYTVIGEEDNGSPTGGRRFILTDFTADDQMPSINKIIATLTENKCRFIAFCHSRRLTEQYYNELIQKYPQIEGKIMPYRSGYEMGDRQRIEKALRDGELCGVISTSALELGVDLPNMEYCLLIGIPSTAMSFWQRVGRVGRSPDKQGKVLIFPSDNSIDDYYRSHPDKLFERPIEELVLHLDNKQLILSHFACARVESGNFDQPNFDVDIFGQDFVELAKNINNLDIIDEILTQPEPHYVVGIRGIGDPTYKIYTSGGEREIGNITWSQILREAYPKAVYRHMGEAYRVESLSSKYFQVKVKKEGRTASTSPVGYISVKERIGLSGTIFRKAVWTGLMEIYHTTVAVTTLTTGYKEKLGNGWAQSKYPTPLQRRVLSEGVWIKFLPDFGECDKDGLNALAHAVSNLYAIHNPCDSAEIATHSVCKKNENYSVMYFFDTTSGGLGISAGIFDYFLELLPLVEERMLTCEHCDKDSFDRGCPSCIHVPRWFEDNEHLSKESALKILKRIIEITQKEPQRHISDSYQHRIKGGFTSISELADQGIEEATEKFGKVLYKAGSQVRMPNGKKGTVKKYEIGQDIFYTLKMEDGRELRVRDMGLNLLKGEALFLCTCCGQEESEKKFVCTCGVELF